MSGQDHSVGRCPQCKNSVSFEQHVCTRCGFPFSCDISIYQTTSPLLRRTSPLMRFIAALAVVLFFLTSGSIMGSGYEAYHGQTQEVVLRLQPVADSGIEISGPPEFVRRTELVLGLLKLRAPDFYWRVQDSVTSIGYFDLQVMQGADGRDISLRGIGAMAQPHSGEVTIMSDTAFPSGRGELFDYDLFSYAGTLVHELRHIELHAQGLAPGGWQEEVLCEEAAYSACRMMEAPPVVLARYQVYLDDPQNQRYQHWYDWYKQQE